jgi:phosphate transport system substrate-binding protein
MLSFPDGENSFTEQKNPLYRRFFLAATFFGLIGLVLMLTVGRGASDKIVGAGSTFAFPLIQRGSEAFQTAKADGKDWVPGSTGIEYEPVGSLGGIMRLRDPEVDFAVTDFPLSKEEASAQKYVQFPIIVGSISPVYNLGNSKAPDLKLSAQTLSAIFSGKVTNWSDPTIKADNPDVTLPDLKIEVVHRTDGSGTTFNFTSYLAAGSAEWKDAFGANTLIKWSTGTGVRGSTGMAEAVKAKAGAIGYLETGQAQRAGLATASVKNDQQIFVAPSPETVAAGVEGMDWSTNTRAASAAPSNGAAPYPIVTAAHVIMKMENTSSRDNERTLRFINFILEERADDAKSLGYLPLPKTSIDAIKKVWASNLDTTL